MRYGVDTLPHIRMHGARARGVLVGLVALGLFVYPSDQSAVVVLAVVAVVLAVINTGPFLPPLTSWGSSRGLTGWMSTDDGL
jgi:hypothetical protein